MKRSYQAMMRHEDTSSVRGAAHDKDLELAVTDEVRSMTLLTFVYPVVLSPSRYDTQSVRIQQRRQYATINLLTG